MADYEVGLKVNVDASELNSLQKNIDSLKSTPINIDVRLSDRSLKSIAAQLNGASGSKSIKFDVDSSGVRRELASIQKSANVTGKLDINTGDARKSLSSIEDQIRRLDSLRIDIDADDDVNATYRQLRQTLTEIARIEKQIGKLDINSNPQEISALESRLESLTDTYNRLKTELQGSLNTSQMSDLNGIIDSTEANLDQLAAKVTDTKNRMAGGIIEKFDTKGFQVELQNAATNLRSFDVEVSGVDESARNLGAAFRELNAAIKSGDTDRIIAANKNWSTALQEARNQARLATSAQKEYSAAQRETADAITLAYNKQKLSLQMDSWLKNNSAAAKDFGGQIRMLQMQLESADNVQFDNISKQFDLVKMKAQVAGQTGLNFADRLREQVKSLSSYFSIASVLMTAIQGARQMYQNVLEVDTAMTELYRVTDLSASQYSSLYDGLVSSAKEYGVVLSDLINATADWSRAGFDADVASQLAEVTAIYQHISDLDYDTASENLLTAYKGFEDDLTSQFDDPVAAISYIGDILNELDNEYAVTAAGLGEGIRRSASALEVAGNSLEESMAMIGGISEVTQDPEKAGNALKTVSMRIRGMKGDLEEMGEESDEYVENISKMQGQIYNLTHGAVNIFDSSGEFKSTYEILDGIADVWDRLSSTDQADLLETIAGKNRANDVAAILGNWENVEAMYQSALNAEGSAAREHEKYVNSMQGRLDSLAAAWQALSNTIMNSDFLSGIIGMIGDAVSALDSFIDRVGIFPALLTAASAAISVRGKGFFRVIEDDAKPSGHRIGTIFGDSFRESISNIMSSIGDLFSGDKLNISSDGMIFDSNIASQLETDTIALQNLQNALNGMDVSVPQAVADSMQDMSESTRIWAEETNLANMSQEKASKAVQEQQQKLSSLAVAQQASNKSLSSARQLINEYNSGMKTTGMSQEAFVSAVSKGNPTLGNYMANLNGATASLRGYAASAAIALAQTLALQAGMMALNMVTGLVVGSLIQGAISAISSWINHEEELADAVSEATSSFKEQHDELSKNRSSFDAAAESYAKLRDGVNDVTNANVSLMPDEYEEYINASNTIADMIPSLVAGYDAQGNAILNCAGDVDTLTEAYNNLIIAANNELLNGDGEDYNGISDIAEDLKNSYNDLLYNKMDSSGIQGQYADDIEKILGLSDINADSIIDAIDTEYSKNTIQVAKNVAEAMEAAGNELEGVEPLSLSMWNTEEDQRKAAEYLEAVAKQYPELLNSAVSEFDSEMDAAAEKMRNAMNAHMENAFLQGEYGNLDDEMQSIATSMVNGIDSEFIAQLSQGENGEQAVLDHVDSILGALDGMSVETQEKFKNAFDLQDAFASGEMSFGEYRESLSEIEETINDLGLDSKVADQLKEALNIDGVQGDYDALIERLNNLGVEGAEEFVNGLNSTELSVIYDVIPEIESGAIDVSDLESELSKAAELQEAMNFTIDIEAETEGIDALNTALSEARSATGLTADSMAALESRYQDLGNYDAARLFEETANGISLNAEAVNEYEQALADSKIAETDENLGVLKDRYDELTQQIQNCDDAAQRAELVADREDIRAQITDLAELATMYEGLTSSYNEWQNAESAGTDRDMYESVHSAMEGIGEELELGWIDDATREYFQLIWGEDNWDGAGKSVQDYRDKWDTLDNTIQGTSYSIQDFFKVNDDGELTSEGIFNFFDAVEQKQKELGENWIQYDDDGNMSFNFGVDGDKAIADALGISEELVQIFLRASQDAGFVVNFDGTYTQLADLQNEAMAAMNSFNEMFDTEYSFNFNTTSLQEAQSDLEEAKKLLDNDDFWNADGTFNFDAKGATEAMQIVSTLQAMVDNLDNKYIGLKVDDATFEEPLEMAQDYERTVAEINQLELDPKANTTRLEVLKEDVAEIVDYFATLDDETKKELNIPVDLEGEELDKQITEMLDNGTLEIPTTLDIQTNMSESLEDLRDIALLNSGLLSEEQEVEVKVRLGLDLDSEEIGDVIRDAGIEDDAEVEVGVEFFADTQDIDEYKPEQIESVVKFVKDVDDIDSYTPEQKQAIARYTADISDIDSYTPEDKKAVCDFIVNNEDVMSYTPEEKTAIAKYLADPQDVDSYDPADKEAITKFIAEHGEVDAWDPEDRTAIATFLLNNALVEGYQPSDKDLDVIAQVNSSNVDNYQPADRTMTVWATIKQRASSLWSSLTGGGGVDGTANVDGTAFVNGTTGKAFRQGNWGTTEDGVALGGELGPELLVRNGRWYTIGDQGAEFFGYKKGDIIFNADQTREIFEKGKITHGNGRGRALAEGTAFSSGTGSKRPSYGSWTASTSSSSSSSSSSKSSSTKSSSNNSSSKKKAEEEAEEFEETFDWIQVAIDRIERAISRLDLKASSVYKNWGTRNSALADQISEVGAEIDLQSRAYDRYIQQANSVGLSEDWASKVRDGRVDINTIQDEDLADKIGQYQEWYEKALDARDVIDELRETESELYQQRFDNVSAEYDGILGVIEHEKNMLEEYINQSEAQAWLVSKEYYNALADNERENIAQLENQRAEMLAQLQSAMDSGTIDKYSESWYDMCQQIDEVTLAIEQGNTALLEYAQTLQQLGWDVFDFTQEKISNIITEAEFLIDLMSNKNLYDDRGQLTDEGMSTMGLHGLNYNVYMSQADDYRKEVEKLNAELAKDPYDQDLIDRRQEMLELQQEMILAAEDEKNAIRDMVEEGIQLELEALQELIDKRNEALDSAKDLYDYQRQVEEQADEVAALEKQLSAYAGDDSEESKSRIQEIKVQLDEARQDLQETEYDQYISDQKQLLDDLYTEYEGILNARLDNIDALISDMIFSINNSADAINSALIQSSANVGYTMSEEMRNIWGMAAQQMQADAANRVEQTTRLINQLVTNGVLSQQDANRIITALGTGDLQGITNATNVINELVNQGKLSTADAQNIQNTMKTTGTEYKTVITTYGTDFQNKATTTNTVLNGIKTDVATMVQKLNAAAAAKTQAASTSSASSSSQASSSTSKPATTTSSSSGGDGVPRVGDRVKYDSGSYYYDSTGTRPLGYHNRGGYVYITKINTASWATHPYHISTGSKLGSGDLGWLKLNQLSGYATGRRMFSSDEIAWTQEDGQEFIVRPSDGAILTPLAKGDSVLNASASQNIWDMANTPSDFIRDNLSLGSVDASAERSVQNTYTQNFENVTFSMPNVKNYDQLIRQMQKDPNFERLIDAMTFDQMAGKSSLAKGKAIR